MSNTPTQPTPENINAELQNRLEHSTHLFNGVKEWGATLAEWHYHKKISPQTFEDALIILARSGALTVDAVDINLDSLYEIVTGEKADIARLVAIINLFSTG